MSKERVPHSFENNIPSTPLWTGDEIAFITQGVLQSSFSANNVVIDSRVVKGGELFVALNGPSFDGHDYVAQALEKGAAGAIVSTRPKGVSIDAPLVIVSDVLKALNDLAVAARKRSKAKIIGITGSFGKTSIKEALRYVLEKEAYTLATERSFNNHWGLPLTLSRLHPDHQYAVIEMGMNSAGEIQSHTNLTKPHIALITNTGNAHIGKMGTQEAIVKAKAEIFEGIVDDGMAVLYSQDSAFESHKAILNHKNIPCVSFGDKADFAVEAESSKTGLQVTVSHDKHVQKVNLPTYSMHWSYNLAAIAACVSCLGLDWCKFLKYMEAFSFPQGRGNIIRSDAGLIVLDESYNAAPTTMANAIQTLFEMSKMNGKRSIAILGDMLELGPNSAVYHKDLVNVAGFSKLSKVYCCGEEMKYLYDSLSGEQKGAWSKDPQDLHRLILKDAQPEDLYLVKGSRGQWAERGRMSSFVDVLMDHKFDQQGDI